MSLSEEVRGELAAIAPRRQCDRLAELSGLFHSAGALHLHGRGTVSLHLDVADPATARRAFSLLRGFGVPSQIRTYRRRAFDGATRYQLHIDGEAHALQVLEASGVVDSTVAPLQRPPRRIVSRGCCRGAYLRGALLGGGSLSAPPSPHLELRTPTAAGAQFLRDVAAAEGIRLGVAERQRHALAYAKGAETIADTLAAAGASDVVLALRERAVVGEARSRANRLANADHANLVRASRAAHEQIEAARRLERTGDLRRLPRRLREIAELRLEHPMDPLRELAARCDPPTTKASAHRRLKKVVELAQRPPPTR